MRKGQVTRRSILRLTGWTTAGILSPRFMQGTSWEVRTEVEHRLSGVWIFGVTPMRNRNGKIEIDLDGVRMNTRFFVSQPGIPVVAVCGGTGEFSDLTAQENRMVVAAAAQEKKNRLLLSGVGGNTTAETVGLAEAAEEAGADAVLVMPSAVIAERGEEALYQHYVDIARSVGVGVVPYRRGDKTFGIETIKRLMELPNLLAVKDFLGDVEFIRKMVQETEGRMPIFPAHERLAPFVHLAGASGFTSGHANFAPEASTRIWRLAQDGKYRDAVSMGEPFRRLDDLRSRYGDILLKAGLEIRGMAGGPMKRGPKELPSEGRSALEKIIRELEA